MLVEFILRAALFCIPAYLANSMPIIFGKKSKPLDFGKKLSDGKPVFGKGKTWKGTIAGIAIGSLGALIVFLLFPAEGSLLGANYLLIGFLISLGALVGDAIASFAKRRLSIKQGSPILIADQLDFVIGGYLFILPFYTPEVLEFLFVCAFTIITHVFVNIAAFKLKVKKVPW